MITDDLQRLIEDAQMRAFPNGNWERGGKVLEEALNTLIKIRDLTTGALSYVSPFMGTDEDIDRISQYEDVFASIQELLEGNMGQS